MRTVQKFGSNLELIQDDERVKKETKEFVNRLNWLGRGDKSQIKFERPSEREREREQVIQFKPHHDSLPVNRIQLAKTTLFVLTLLVSKETPSKSVDCLLIENRYRN
jgi:hypothetical protein